jgi:hypothetical protein
MAHRAPAIFAVHVCFTGWEAGLAGGARDCDERMTVHHLTALNLVIGTPPDETTRSRVVRPPRRRKTALVAAIRAAQKAGMNVTGASLTLDGSVSLKFGGQTENPEANPWDGLFNAQDEKRPS